MTEMNNIKKISLVSAGVLLAIYFFGMIVGWVIKPTTNSNTPIKSSGPCDLVREEYQSKICYAKVSCEDGGHSLDNFNFNSLTGAISFNCK